MALLNPDCRVVTVGPHTDPTKRVNVGQACHIEAASEGGPRYNKEMQKIKDALLTTVFGFALSMQKKLM